MPRKPPCYEPGRFYHLVAKFVADEFFVKTELDRAYYLRLLGDALRLTDWRCFAFAVMSNHTHLAVQAGTGKLAPWLRLVHGPFAEWINQREDRGGAVFKRGPWGGEVPQDRVAHLVAYIHRNPVRAALVETAAESSWTSHQMYIGGSQRPSWLDVDLGRALMPFSSPQQFEEWVDDGEVERASLMETRVWGDGEEAEEDNHVPALPGPQSAGSPGAVVLDWEGNGAPRVTPRSSSTSSSQGARASESSGGRASADRPASPIVSIA